jgi:hypothetical protein
MEEIFENNDIVLDIEENADLIQQNDILIDENEKLKKNMEKLMENYPKDLLYERIISNKCAICLENYKYKDKICVTNCYHIYHKKCIDDNFEQGGNTCPECRFDLNNSIFMYLEFGIRITGMEIS